MEQRILHKLEILSRVCVYFLYAGRQTIDQVEFFIKNFIKEPPGNK
jgi:hypothetical protein